MKFNLLSENKRIVNIIMLISSTLMGVGLIMQLGTIGNTLSILVLGMALLMASWSAFSYSLVKAKESDSRPSKIIANISFLVLSIFWGILLAWIHLI